jgi:predicted N-acyltransferase
MTARVLRSIHEVSATDWNALELRGQPFLQHEFLAALEDTACVGGATGWTPSHLLLLDDASRLIAAVPLYLKTHSYGEFVFDFSWAQSFDRAFHQLGQRYYPKLVSAVPFTPATGPRLLLAKHVDVTSTRRAVLAALQVLCEELDLSSAHVLFADSAEYKAMSDANWLPRTSCQFHWFNRGYASMDDFLTTFRADKRKKAKRERRRVLEEYGIRYQTLSGADLSAEQWRTVFSFSENTFHQHGH